jgi:2-methylisocitrate lyase-like PEP mutase family enzyme
MKLAERLNSDEILVAPGICDAFGMMMVAKAGFEAAYLSWRIHGMEAQTSG